MRRHIRRLLRRLLCRLGFHRWQFLYKPPHDRGADYTKGIWCIFCGKEWKS